MFGSATLPFQEQLTLLKLLHQFWIFHSRVPNVRWVILFLEKIHLMSKGFGQPLFPLFLSSPNYEVTLGRQVLEDIRERYFGPSFELMSHDKVSTRMSGIYLIKFFEAQLLVDFSRELNLFYVQYPEIWALDEKDPFARPEGGESAADVAARLARAMETMESEFQG